MPNNHENVSGNGRQHTITINDTPSPSVSVITISDSEDEATTDKKAITSSQRAAQQTQTNSSNNIQRKNVISCVTLADSDNEDHKSPTKIPTQSYQQVIKNEPNQNNTNYNNVSQSRKTRLLAKAQSECMLNVPTKQEPGLEYQHHRSNDYLIPQQHSSTHCSSACKEPVTAYQYVNAGSSGHINGQDQHVVYSTGDKRVSWAPPVAHAPSSHSNRRHSAVVNLREYNLQAQNHKEYMQPPAAHTTRDSLAIGREQHLLPPGKSWGPPQAIHQGYR